MRLQINGEFQSFERTGFSLEELFKSLKIKKENTVCELNKNVVGKDAYPQTILKDNDALEIVHFVGGG